MYVQRANSAVILLCVLLAGCSTKSTNWALIGSRSKPIVYEGLPHSHYEDELFDRERRAKPTVEFLGSLFYQEPLKIKQEDEQNLKALLGNGGTFRSFRGEKECGGFHADYAVEWTVHGKTFRYLICFGCGEAKVMEGQKENRYDLDMDARKRLAQILKPHRKNRPQPSLVTSPSA